MVSEFQTLIFQKSANLLALCKKGKLKPDEAFFALMGYCVDMITDATTFIYSTLYTFWEDPRQRKKRGKGLYKQLIRMIRTTYKNYERRMLHLKRADIEHMIPDIQQKLDDELRKRGAL